MIIRACKEGAVLNNSGNCRVVDRIWVDVPVDSFVITTIDPSVYAPTFLAFFAVVSMSYFAGMSIRSILRFIR